jgi:hypothetical protein
VTATFWSTDRAFALDHPHELVNVRDIEVQLDDTGKLLWLDYCSALLRVESPYLLAEPL